MFLLERALQNADGTNNVARLTRLWHESWRGAFALSPLMCMYWTSNGSFAWMYAVLARCEAESIRIPLAPPNNARRASKLNIEIVAHHRERQLEFLQDATECVMRGWRQRCMHCCRRNVLDLVGEAKCTPHTRSIGNWIKPREADSSQVAIFCCQRM